MIAETMPTKAQTEIDLPIDEIFADPSFNCRGAITAASVHSLANDIKTEGLLQSISVQPYNHPINPRIKYRVLAGHRRFLACKFLQWPTIPGKVIGGLSELQARKINLKENIERKDLNIMQEAEALRPFKKAGWTQQQVADEFGVTKGWVQPRFALLELEEPIQKFAAAGYLTQEQIKDVYALSPSDRIEAVKKLIDARIRQETISIRQPKKKKDPTKRRARKPDEIFQMLEWLYDLTHPGLHTRALAWAAGEISDADLIRDVKKYCENEGIAFSLPDGYAAFSV